MNFGPALLGSLERRRSSGAEQLSCKQQVVGSNPTAGSLQMRESRPVRTRSDFERGARDVSYPAGLAQPRLPGADERRYGHAAGGRDSARA